MAAAIKRRGTVYLREEEERHGPKDRVLLGTFSGSWDTNWHRPYEECAGQPLAEALAWARARSDRVVVELDWGDEYWAGADPTAGGDRYPRRWPPAHLPALVRRRPPGLEYVDRVPDDPPTSWDVVLWLRPVGEPDDTVLAELQDRVPAMRGWDRRELDAFLAERARAVRRARRAGSAEMGWASAERFAYRVRLSVGAATESLAVRSAVAALGLPNTLHVDEAEALPAPA